MQVFLNNDFVPLSDAHLHISDLAIQRGYGIFDFFRVRHQVPLYVEDHLDRFEQSARHMHLTVPFDRQRLREIIRELVQRNKVPDAGVRMLLTGGYSPDAYQPVEPNFLVQQSPLTFEDSLTPKSVRVMTHEYIREIPQAKTINYTMGIWLLQKMREQQADDVLYHQKGVVTEFPRCNFFIVTRNNTIITPDRNALMGVTRKKILEHCSEHFKIAEDTVTLDDIRMAREAFLTSSTKRVQAVVQVDQHHIGDGQPGPVTTEVLRLLIEAEKTHVEQNRS